MAVAVKAEEARRRILEKEQPKSFTELYSPALKELKFTPPVLKFAGVLREAPSPFTAVLTKERTELDNQALKKLKGVNSNLRKVFPTETLLINNAIAETELRLKNVKRTQKAEDYKLFYKDFAKVSRALNHLVEAAVKGEMLKGKALEVAKKALDITYSISEFVVPPVMIAGKMTGAKEEKISKVDKAMIAVSFVPFAGVAVKTARLGRGAVLVARAGLAADETAQAIQVAKESAFLARMGAKAKMAVKAAERAREAVPSAFKSTHGLLERFGSDKILLKIGKMLPPEFQDVGESVYYLKNGTRTAKTTEMIAKARVYFANSLVNLSRLNDKQRILFSAYTNPAGKGIGVVMQDAAKEFVSKRGTYAEAELFINEMTIRVRQISLKTAQRSFGGHLKNPSMEQLILFARVRHLGGNAILAKFQALPEIFLDIIKSEEAVAKAAKAGTIIK